MDNVKSTDSKKLEGLAISFARDVLRLRKRSRLDNVILYGYDESVLGLIREMMKPYFNEKSVKVFVNTKEEGYRIDVGYFMRH